MKTFRKMLALIMSIMLLISIVPVNSVWASEISAAPESSDKHTIEDKPRNDVYEEPYDCLEQGHKYEFAERVPETCVDQAYDLYICSECGSTEYEWDEDTQSLGHNDTGIVATYETCSWGTVERHSCSRCDGFFLCGEPGDGHSFTDGACVNCNYEDGSFDYWLDDRAGGICVTFYYGDSDVVNVPSEIDGIPVTALGGSVFSYNDNLREVTIPSTVTDIGNGIFEYSQSLETVLLNAEIEELPMNMFHGCVSLENVVIPSSVKSIGESAFYRCQSLEKITIPALVNKIENRAFAFCSALKKITIPAAATELGDELFIDCYALEKVTINAPLAEIPYRMFGWCYALEDVNIPETVNKIGEDAFYCCETLEEIELPASVSEIEKSAFTGCLALKKINIPDGVTAIEELTFNYCEALEELEIPASVKKIGERAFNGCISLKSVTLNEGLEEIGAYAFFECSSLAEVEIPDSVTSVGERMLDCCHSLGKLVIGDSITEIPEYFASDCPELRVVYIPASVENIGMHALPYGLWHIFTSASETEFEALREKYYNECYSDALRTETHYEVDGIYITEEYKIAPTCTESGGGSFSCDLCKEENGEDYDWTQDIFYIPALPHDGTLIESVPAICTTSGYELYVCDACYELYKVYTDFSSHPEDALELKKDPIDNCTFKGLTSYWCNECNSNVWDYDWTSYYEHSYSGGVCTECGVSENITDYYYDETYGGIVITGYNLNSEKVKIPETIEGIPVVGIGPWTFSYSGAEEVILPDTLKVIGFSCFEYCTELVSINIPDGVTEIGSNAFCCCEKLESIEIPDSVTVLEGNTFLECRSLKEITIPGSVKKIESWCFSHCESLEKVTLKEGVMVIGDNVFQNCGKLTDVSLPSTLVKIGNEAFNMCSMLVNISVPASVHNIGAYAFNECVNLEAVEIPEGITVIQHETFLNCKSLEAVKFPASLKEIRDSAFSNCNSLENISLPEGLEKIGDWAFSDCRSVEELIIPDSVTEIGDAAFNGCNSLKRLHIGEGISVIPDGAFNFCSALHFVYLPAGLTEIEEAAFNSYETLHVYTSMSEADFEQLVIAPEWDGRVITADMVHFGCTEADFSYITQKAPDCTNSGELLFNCNRCDFELSVYADMLPHKTGSDFEIINTCNLGVLKKEHCETCGQTVYTELDFFSEGHNIENGVCTVCGADEGFEYFLNEAGTGIEIAEYSGNAEVVIIPDTIEGIAVERCWGYAFNFSNVRKVIWPASIKCISDYVFADCEALEEIVIPEGITQIGEGAFFGASALESITLPSTIEVFGDGAFALCTSLEEFVIPEKVNGISIALFGYCTSLKSVTMHDGIEYIDEGAFYGCESLDALYIPASVEFIGAMTFLLDDENRDINKPVHIFYGGTKSEFEAIDLLGDNLRLEHEDTVIHYSSEYNVSEKLISAGTCATGGKAGVICNVCNKTISEYFTAAGVHNFTAQVKDQKYILSSGTCTTPAKYFKSCSVCGAASDKETFNGDVNKNIHAATTTRIESSKAATCTVPGYSGDKVYICCGAIAEKGKATAATGHKWGAYVTVTEAAVGKDGKQTRTCSACKATESKAIPAIQEIEVFETASVKVNEEFPDIYVCEGVNVNSMIKSVSEGVQITDINGNKVNADQPVATGMKISIMDGGKVVDEKIIVVPFDVDCDGKASSADARLALRESVGLEALAECQKAAADVDDKSAENKVTSADARSILREAVGLDDGQKWFRENI